MVIYYLSFCQDVASSVLFYLFIYLRFVYNIFQIDILKKNSDGVGTFLEFTRLFREITFKSGSDMYYYYMCHRGEREQKSHESWDVQKKKIKTSR